MHFSSLQTIAAAGSTAEQQGQQPRRNTLGGQAAAAAAGRRRRALPAPVAVLPELRQRVFKHLVLLGAAGHAQQRKSGLFEANWAGAQAFAAHCAAFTTPYDTRPHLQFASMGGARSGGRMPASMCRRLFPSPAAAPGSGLVVRLILRNCGLQTRGWGWIRVLTVRSATWAPARTL